MAMFPSLIILIVVVLAGLAALAGGGYALYTGLIKKDSDSIFVGSTTTVVIIGIVAMLIGLGIFCSLIAGAFLLFANAGGW